MKQFLMLILTFSGICASYAQPAKDSSRIGVPDSSTAPAPGPRTPAKPSMRIVPNPARYKTTVEVQGFLKGPVRIKFLDPGGYAVREELRYLFSGTENIVMMFSLDPGVYVIEVRQDDRTARKKLLVR